MKYRQPTSSPREVATPAQSGKIVHLSPYFEGIMHRYLFLTLIASLLLVNLCYGQAKKPPERPVPTKADVVYSSAHPRCKLDFWQATSDNPAPLVILIHGGGWTSGDKTGYAPMPFSHT